MLFLSAIILVSSGCSVVSEPDPQEVVTEMITNMQQLTAAKFEVSSTIKQNDPETNSSFEAELQMTGKTNAENQKVPSSDLDINISVKTKDADKGDINGDANFMLTLTDGNIYFKLGSLNLPEELQGQVESFVSLYLGNWYKFPNELVPDNIKNQIAATEEDPNKAKIEELIRNTKLFNVTESNTKSGQYVYQATIEQEGLKTIASEMAKIEGQPLTDAELGELSTFFENYNHNVTLYIDQSTKYLNKIEATIDSKNADENPDITLKANFSNHNQAQEISAPADAQDFNPMSLMGLGMMLEGSQGTSLNEEAGDFEDLDLSELENMNMEDLENLEEEMQNLGQDLENMGTELGEEMEALGENLGAELDVMMEGLPITE